MSLKQVMAFVGEKCEINPKLYKAFIKQVAARAATAGNRTTAQFEDMYATAASQYVFDKLQKKREEAGAQGSYAVYRCAQKCIARIGFELDSEKVGFVQAGSLLEVLETRTNKNGQRRHMFMHEDDAMRALQCWCSEASLEKSKVFLTKVETTKYKCVKRCMAKASFELESAKTGASEPTTRTPPPPHVPRPGAAQCHVPRCFCVRGRHVPPRSASPRCGSQCQARRLLRAALACAVCALQDAAAPPLPQAGSRRAWRLT